MKYIVKKHEIGLLFKNQSFIKAVPSGTYRFGAWSGKQILSVDKRYKFAPDDMDIALFRNDEKITVRSSCSTSPFKPEPFGRDLCL